LEGALAKIEDNERRIIRRRAVFRVRIGVPVNESNILTTGGLLDYMTTSAVGAGPLWILPETDGNETGGKMARNHAC
jgi:hypothetical protein